MNVKQLNEFVKSGIEALNQIELANGDLTAIAEAMEEKLGISKAEAKKLIKTAYQKLYDTEKYTITKEKIENLYEYVEAVDESLV